MSINLTLDISTIYVRNCLENQTTKYQKTLEQLSSGTRFTTIGEDPVGVSNSAKIESELDSNEQSLSNIALSGSLLAIAEDGQRNITSNLQRIHDLCVQAANETYSPQDKDAILEEIKQRLTEIDRTVDSTKYQGISLLDGSSSDLSLALGHDSSIEVGTALINAHASQLGGDIRLDDTVTGTSWTTADIKLYMDKVDAAVNTLTNTCAQIGGFCNRLDMTSDNLSKVSVNLTAQKSAISDTDTAVASADLIRYQIMQQASISVLTQANQVPEMVISLFAASS